VERKFNELGVVRMKADWTKSDPVIASELKKYGRNSVPLYLLYSPRSDEPAEVMPQVLTSDIVLEYLDKLPHKS
jgi:thiol:disulfide interchange protein DsbD